MKFSERWLRTLADPPLSSTGLADRLTMAGLEVEAMAPVAPAFSGVVVGHILTVDPHPNADRLRVCTVDAGGAAPLTIVCGAPNAVAGMKAPCALPGAILPDGRAITVASVRGVASSGMLCSAAELRLADDASGLHALPGDAPVGANLRDALDLDDMVLTLKLTPNRADCLSMLGIAREVAAITSATLMPPPAASVAVTSDRTRALRVEDGRACPRFVGRVIDGVNPQAPTPAWMRQRLERCGIRSISAIVDVTNYVMLERGQPLHAYDDRRLEGALVVRFARAGERLTLLNGQSLDLAADLLLVCDEDKPLGLAGIMGGEHSGIDATTTAVYLEGAFWNPDVIQGRSRRLGFASDAGHRFERGVDFAGCAIAVERATALILEICGGHAGPLTDCQGELPARAPVRVRPARVARLLGIDVSPAAIDAIFDRLKFARTREGADFIVTPPSYRFDLAIEEDFVEEIARLTGYDAIPSRQRAHLLWMLPERETTVSVHTLKRQLAARDWQEAINFSFVDSRWEEALFPERGADARPIAVLNPIASNLDVMRTTLLGGLLEVLRANLARRADRIRVFESGRVFLRRDGVIDQPIRLAGLACGDALPEQWGTPKRGIDIFDVKADLEALVAPRLLTTARATHPALHPGRSAEVRVDGAAVGWLGELHPRLSRLWALPRPAIVFELDLAPLLLHPFPTAVPVSKLPIVRRDISVILDESIPADDVLAALRSARSARIEVLRLFDNYRGPAVPSGKKSLAILVLIQDTERTLTDAEIESTVAELRQLLRDRFDGTLRE